jgi:hypothetical protein
MATRQRDSVRASDTAHSADVRGIDGRCHAVQREYRRGRGHRLEAAWAVVEIGIKPRPHECAKMPLTVRSLGSFVASRCGCAPMVCNWRLRGVREARKLSYAQASVQQTSS